MLEVVCLANKKPSGFAPEGHKKKTAGATKMLLLL